MTTYTEDQMTAIGGRPWQGADGTRRIYFNGWLAYIGLDLEHYKTGNISHAELDGTKLSNGSASKLAAAQVYWQDGAIYTNLDTIADGIRLDGDAILTRLLDGIASAVHASENAR